jgi:hypothetical protein
MIDSDFIDAFIAEAYELSLDEAVERHMLGDEYEFYYLETIEDEDELQTYRGLTIEDYEWILNELKTTYYLTRTHDRIKLGGKVNGNIYKWNAKCSGLDVAEAKRLKTLEEENTRLKQL